MARFHPRFMHIQPESAKICPKARRMKKQFDCARRPISGVLFEAVELRRRTDRIRDDVF
jgi:hypothetical protein